MYDSYRFCTTANIRQGNSDKLIIFTLFVMKKSLMLINQSQVKERQLSDNE